MIINEGIKVRLGADNTNLLSGLRGGKLAVAGFATAAATALAGVAAASTRMAAQLDRDLRLVSTLGGEAAGNTERLRQEVQSLGREFGRNFNELARANYQAVSGGFKSIADSMALTRAGTRLAVAGNADLVGSTEAVVKALNAFDLSANEAEDAAAQLWGITRDGIITVEQLGRFLADLPTTAAASGVGFEELSAAISTLTANGVPASTAMDQLRSAIIGFERTGLTGSLVDRTRAFVGQGLEEIRKQVGDQTAARGILVLARNLGTFEQNVSAAGDVTDDYNDAVDTMTEGALSEWERLQQNLAGHMQDLGSALNEVVVPGVKALNAVLEETPEDKLIRVIDAAGQRIPTGPNRASRDAEELGSILDTPNPLTNVPGDVPVNLGTQLDTAPGLTISGPNPVALVPPSTVLRPGDIPFQGRATPAEREFIGGTLDFDFESNAEEIREAHEAMQDVGGASQFAAGAAGILSSTVGGLLTSAFVTAESGAARFVQGLLAQFAQLGVNALVSNIFPGFARGGYTGSIGAGNVAGVVHGNEYVFNEQAVRSLGLGRLERMHAMAGAGTTENTLNITVNAPSGSAQAIASVTADSVGRAMRDMTSQHRNNLHATAAAKYRG